MRLGSGVTVVVPAWNEAPRIGRVIRGLPQWVDAVVVVDDASADGTGGAVRECGDPRVVLVRHERNAGVGAAIATGYRQAALRPGGGRDAFVVMAGDGQMHPDDLPAVVDPIAKGAADYVKGNRFAWPCPRMRSQMPVARRLGGRVLSWATATAIGRPVSDSQCGYTALARDAYGKLDLSRMWPRYGYPNDLLSLVCLRGLRVAEVPVRPVYADEISRLRPYHVLTIASLIGRAWLRRLVAVDLAR